MTKEQELKLLEQIDALIKSAGEDSYIHDTFERIADICHNNIVNDWYDRPAIDLENLRERMIQNDAEHGHRLIEVEHERDCLRSQLEEKDAKIQTLNVLLESAEKVADEWEKNSHEAGELYVELEKECAEKDAEIMRLKAEIYDLRKECGK